MKLAVKAGPAFGGQTLTQALETSLRHAKHIRSRGKLPTSRQLERVHLELNWLVLKTRLGMR